MKPIPGFERYLATERGDIFSTITNRELKPANCVNGYQFVSLRADGRTNRVLIHRAVATAFLGAPPPGHEVNHKDGDKRHNAASNLEYVTRAGNAKHALMAGLFRFTKLSAADALAIRESTATARDAAAKYGITTSQVRRIRSGAQWVLVGGPRDPRKRSFQNEQTCRNGHPWEGNRSSRKRGYDVCKVCQNISSKRGQSAKRAALVSAAKG